MARSAYDYPSASECMSMHTATEPSPNSFTTARSIAQERLPSGGCSLVKGYMQPTSSFLAKCKSKKARARKTKVPKGYNVAGSSTDSSKQGKGSESLVSACGTMDSGWELSTAQNCAPTSNKIVAEWLHECDIIDEESIGDARKICLARSQVGDRWVVVSREDSLFEYSSQKASEAPVEDNCRKPKNRRRFLGHVCSFLLGIGTMTLLGALN